jgi:hypothetical protein
LDDYTPVTAAERAMKILGMEPDPWQLEVLRGRQSRLLLNCCRQAGKSTVVAVHALLHAIYSNRLPVLLLSRSHRQSAELFGVVRRFYERLKGPLKKRQTVEELELNNGSRIVCLPCKEETIRGYANVGLLIIDEAARVPDELYRAVRPMLAISEGRLICMPTPYGKRGFYYEAWANGGDDWQRMEIHAEQVPRITPLFLAQERRCLGDSFFRQEYQCSFESIEGLVYPGLVGCALPPTAGAMEPLGKRVGGMDFGYNSPFAAVWGVLDGQDILWLTGEHFCRGRPLSYHVGKIPKKVFWYCDPAGANERAELRCADFKVVKGVNAIRPGIAAVSARIQSGRLRILPGQCPNLLMEAGLYRYDPRLPDAETPLDEHNHAMDALRYLVSSLDKHRLARPARGTSEEPASAADGAVRADATPAKPKPKPWLRYDNEELWTPFRF